MERALQYIEDNLTRDYTLEEVAEAANYSMFYFHRLFTSHFNETLAGYIRKRRLSEAARVLLNTSTPIARLARLYGFKSQEAFTRAFLRYHQTTPGRMRLTRATPDYCPPLIKTIKAKGAKMKPRIEQRDEFVVAGLSGRFKMSNNTIPQLWDTFNKREKELHALYIGPMAAYGVCYHCDCTSGECDDSKDMEFTYMAGLLVKGGESLPQDMEERRIPAGKWAIFEHVGPLDTLGETYHNIYSRWLEEAGLEVAKRDEFEYYDERFKWGQPDSVFEIWVPIK